MIDLVGKKILAIRRDPKSWHLAFETDQGTVGYRGAYYGADNETWFHHVVGVPFLLGAKVLRVDTVPEHKSYPATRLEVTEPGKESQRTHDKVLGWKLYTDKGTAKVEMRNSSNRTEVYLFEEAHEVPPYAQLVTEDF